MKKLLAVTLALCLLVSAVGCAGNGGNSGSTSTPGTNSTANSQNTQTSQAASKPETSTATGEVSTVPVPEIVEITSLVWDRGTIPEGMGTLEDNWWVTYVNEQLEPLGVKVSYVIVPQQQNVELLSTMLAGQNAPDASRVSDNALMKTYIASGGITDLTDLIDTYGANIKTYYSEAQLADGQVDGKQYLLYHKQNDFMRTTFVRSDWLDALNMKAPTNPQEFRDMLVAFKENDPGHVGDALIPFAMMTQSFAAWDVVILPAFLKEEPTTEKMLVPKIMWPETKECLRYLNGLYNDGLMGEFILDKDQSLFKQAISRGELGAFVSGGQYPYHSAYGFLYDALRETVPDAKLTAIWPWVSESGANYYQLYDTPPCYKYSWFVPSSSQKAEAAVKYLDWMCTDNGYMVGCLGIQGEDYDLVDGVPVVLQEASQSRVTWIEPQYGTIGKPFCNPEDVQSFIKNYIKDFNKDYHEEILATAKVLSEVKYYKPVLKVSTPITDDVASTLSQLLSDNLAKLMCAAPGEFDAVFDAFLAEYESSGGRESADELVAAYRQSTGQ